jgi:hypothetical protein
MLTVSQTDWPPHGAGDTFVARTGGVYLRARWFEFSACEES